MIDFKGSHFERDIILWGVRWYVAYPMSYRQLEEMMEERGVEVDHSTLNRWVLKYVPSLEQAFRKRKRPVGASWRMDETYVRIKGAWKYLYRAVDKAGATIDFLLTGKRDRKAALRFLHKAIGNHGTPKKITIDKSGANAAAIESYNAEQEADIEMRQAKYLNNVLEQDHRAIKRTDRHRGQCSGPDRLALHLDADAAEQDVLDDLARVESHALDQHQAVIPQLGNERTFSVAPECGTIRVGNGRIAVGDCHDNLHRPKLPQPDDRYATLDKEARNRLLLHTLPSVITHNYHPARGAFRNVCCLPPADAEQIIAAIRAEGASFRKADYLDRRLRTEAWLIAERARKLGETPLGHPIYFFLGDMADGGDQSRPASIIVPLGIFDARVLTFTYPDSMTSCPHARRPGDAASGYHGKVCTLREIEDVVCRHGVPDPKLPRDLRGADAFIEVQVWDDRPLAAYRH